MGENKKKENKNILISLFDIIIAIAIVATFAFGYRFALEIESGTYTASTTLNDVDKMLKNKIPRDEMENTPGGGIYKLKIDGRTDWMPVIEGDDLTLLSRGIGHHTPTGHPGDSRQIFLSAHRETQFRELEFTKPGDTVFVHTSYGKFEYIVDRTKIVKETQVDVIKTEKLSEDELVLMTCWPFNSWTDPKERFLIYAYPKK